jgi:uncharacterized protein YbbC (DUF1343 family)
VSPVDTGLDRMVSRELTLPVSGKVALLCNSTTVDRGYLPTAEAVSALPNITLRRILSPQHGFGSEKQDNMIESSHGTHPTLGVEIHSLYSTHRAPGDDSFNDIDAVVIDLQDIGTRVYTFINTALLTLTEAARRSIPVVILDRPNPITGAMAGPVLDYRWKSFVGMLDIPLRHGLTLGEICLYGAVQQNLIDPPPARTAGADMLRLLYKSGNGFLAILPAGGWSRGVWFDETRLPWTMPSPNMPTFDTAICYPGQVALEGTNLSEGRGTTRPFEMFGAPWLDPSEVLLKLETAGMTSSSPPATPLAGTLLRSVTFEPTFQKHGGSLCRGFQVHVTNREHYSPVSATVALLWAIRRAHGDAFAWRQPPYEYEETLLPVDLIFGTDQVRFALDAETEPQSIIQSWEDGLAAFRKRCRPCIIYGT